MCSRLRRGRRARPLNLVVRRLRDTDPSLPRRKTPKHGRYSPEDQIALFMRRGRELWESRVRRAGLAVSFRIEYRSEDKTISHSLAELDSADLRSFLIIFRKFISDDSPIFLPSIYNLCHQFISNDE